MPTYDYVCESCGHEFEHFQSMSDKRLSRCPKCHKARLVRKVGGGTGVIFKGSGFYATDYKKTSPPPAEAGGCGKPECPATPGTCAANAKKEGGKDSGKDSGKK